MIIIQLLLHDSANHPTLGNLLKKKHKYTPPVVQNELLSIMADVIVQQIARAVNSSKFFSIMIDETTDCSNKEQMVLCLR